MGRGTYPLLEHAELSRGHGVTLANDGDDIDEGGEAAHQLNVDLAEAEPSAGSPRSERRSLRMTGRRDKVQQGMHSVVPEPRVPLDSGLFGENAVVLTFKVG